MSSDDQWTTRGQLQRAMQGASTLQLRTALGGNPVGRAAVTEFERLSPDGPTSRAVQLILSGSPRDVPVDDRGRSQVPAAR